MNKNGINIPQSQFEALFLSSEHNEEHVKFLSAFKEFAENISKNNSNLKVLQKGVKIVKINRLLHYKIINVEVFNNYE